jgi:hypothetical protein
MTKAILILYIKQQSMKKLLLIGFLFTMLSSLQAQKNMAFGVGSGINISNVTDKFEGGTYTPSARVGFKAYLFFDMPVTKYFAIQPELGYDGLGYKFNDGNVNASEQINYLTFSVLPKIKIRESGVAFFGGPTLAFLLNSKASDGQGNSGSTSDFYSSMDVFGVLGVEYFTPVGLGISCRFMQGFTNIVKDTQDGETVHNNVISFSLAYRFKR